MEPIPEMDNKEADRLGRLKDVRSKDMRDAVGQGGAKVTQKEAFAKRRGLKKINKAKLNQNEKEPAIDMMKDAPFIPAFMAATLKDIFDLVILALEAAAGASVALAPLIAVGIALSSVMTWCISIFIGFMLILAGQGGKRKRFKRIAFNIIKRGIVWGGFTIAESVPGLGALPLETAMVGVILAMVIAERKKLVKLNIIKFPDKKSQNNSAEDFEKAA